MEKSKILNFKTYKVSCENCRLNTVCVAMDMTPREMKELDRIIERPAPLHSGKHIYRQSDKFNHFYVIRSGSVKNYTDTRSGTEHVLGFTLPGEMLTLDVIAHGTYNSSAIALETTGICKLPFDAIESLCHRLPRLQKNLFNIAAKEIAAVRNLQLLMSQRSSEERLAVFLLNLSTHRERFGYSRNSLYLSMARHDIANYLGLACETVSRIFTKFSSEGVLQVKKRFIEIRDFDRLTAVANASDLDLVPAAVGSTA